MILGTIGIIYCLFIMNVSVEVNYPNGNAFGFPQRVNNIGLMADRQNYILASCVAILLGIFLVSYNGLVNKKIENNEANSPKNQVVSKIWTGKEILKTIFIVLLSSLVVGFIFLKFLQHYY